jgi:hypothetical protein
MNRANMLLERGFIGFVRSVKNLVLEVNKASKSFERATGNIFGPSVTKQVQATYKELNIYGVSAEQAYKAQLGLGRVVTDFTTYNATQQAELRESALLFEQLGANTESYFKGLQGAIKFFSMTPIQAEKTSREIYATAEALGEVPGDLIDRYAQMGPTLAKFGNEGGKAFKELARIQKITGYEMEKILQLTNRFDTFEGAAQQAGQLNAALGGNFVNAMDLMMETNPADRFMMIRDALEQTGLTFDEMSYYQKQFYTNSLGLNSVGELAQIMSGDMDGFGDATNRTAKEYEEMRKNAKAVQNVQEAFGNIIRNNADGLVALADTLSTLTGWLLKNESVIKTVVLGYVGLKTAVLVYNGVLALNAVRIGTVNTLKAIGAGLSWKSAAANKVDTLSEIENAAAKDVNTGSQLRNNAAGAAGIMTFIKLGAAVALFGIGIGVAAMGMADLIGAFETAGWRELGMAGATLAGVAVGAFFMSKGLYAVGAAGTASAVGLLAAGAAVFMIGAGIGIAAAGVSLLVSELGKLSGDQIVQVGIGLVSFAASIGILAGALVLLSNPLSMTGAVVLAGLGATVGVLGKALGFFRGKKADSFKKMVPVLDAMGSVSEQQFIAAQNAFKGMKESINKTEADQLDDYSRMLGRMAAAAKFEALLGPRIASAVVGRTAGPTQGPGPRADAGSTQNLSLSVDVPIKLEIGGKALDDHILKLTKDAEAGTMRAALQNRGAPA